MRVEQDTALQDEQKENLPSCLEDDTASPQSFCTQLHVRPLRNAWGCRRGPGRFQVAADCWVGIVQGHAAQPKGCQNPPDPQGNRLQKRSAPQKQARLAVYLPAFFCWAKSSIPGGHMLKRQPET